MENRMIEIEHLVNLLIQKSGLTVGALAKEIGVTRQTLSNWRKGYVHSLDSQTIKKLNDAIEKNSWGIQLGNISGSTIEIINIPRSSNVQINKDDKKVSDLEQLVIKLTSENLLLREKLGTYEASKH